MLTFPDIATRTAYLANDRTLVTLVEIDWQGLVHRIALTDLDVTAGGEEWTSAKGPAPWSKCLNATRGDLVEDATVSRRLTSPTVEFHDAPWHALMSSSIGGVMLSIHDGVLKPDGTYGVVTLFSGSIAAAVREGPVFRLSGLAGADARGGSSFPILTTPYDQRRRRINDTSMDHVANANLVEWNPTS